MGLFRKKEPVYNEEQGKENKIKMRSIFNKVVKDGDTYQILSAYTTESKYTKGFVYNTNTTTIYSFILGYREQDDQILLLPVDRDLTAFGEYTVIDKGMVKEAKINNIRKLPVQAAFIFNDQIQDYACIVNFEDSNASSACIPNIHQEDERLRFIAFVKEYNKRRNEENN